MQSVAFQGKLAPRSAIKANVFGTHKDIISIHVNKREQRGKLGNQSAAEVMILLGSIILSCRNI